jgi:hypothetical protein
MTPPFLKHQPQHPPHTLLCLVNLHVMVVLLPFVSTNQQSAQSTKSPMTALCLLQHDQTVESTVCNCFSGWAGVGCEVAVPTLHLDTPTTLLPVNHPDMKLTWNSSLNANWSLLQLQVHALL